MATGVRFRVGDHIYDYEPGSMTNSEAMAIEKVMGKTFDQWMKDLTAGSMYATTALVWHLQRRENPGLRFDDVTFTLGDFDIVPDEETTSDTPATGATEFVPGGTGADFDPKDHGTAPAASTDDA
jgi:hypothetical protein